MELLREALDHTVEEILLSHGIFGFAEQFDHFGKHLCLVDSHIDSLETADSHQVLADQHFEILTLFHLLSFVLSTSDSHPEMG
jgi:hypothetical protein